MVTDSFREYLQLLEDADDLVSISELVSWDLEASAVTTLANRNDGEVPIFESVEETAIDAALVGDPYRGPSAGRGSSSRGHSDCRTCVPGRRTTRQSSIGSDHLESRGSSIEIRRPVRRPFTSGQRSTSCRFPGRTFIRATAGDIRISTLLSRRTRRHSGDTGRTIE